MVTTDEEGQTVWTSTLFLEPNDMVTALLARRRELGLDGRDEIWQGVYHVAPPEHGRTGMTAMALAHLLHERAHTVGLRPGGSFNLGEPDDFRVPDLGFHRAGDRPALYYASAVLVVEVLSPGDETYAKFGFYAAHQVEELWVVDPRQRSVRIWQLATGEDDADPAYAETGTSGLLGLTADAVSADLDWPEG